MCMRSSLQGRGFPEAEASGWKFVRESAAQARRPANGSRERSSSESGASDSWCGCGDRGHDVRRHPQPLETVFGQLHTSVASGSTKGVDDDAFAASILLRRDIMLSLITCNWCRACAYA